MAASRTRTIQISSLNIAMHAPHPRASYASMFQDAFELRGVVRLGGVYAATLGSLHGTPESRMERLEVSGEIYRFVKLDADEPWFNSVTRAEATEDERNRIAIPAHLLPHLQRIPFLFRIKTHRLYLVAKDRKDTMSAATARQFFEVVLNRLTEERGYPPFEVTVRPDHDALDQILAMAALEHLIIEVRPPNPDDGQSEEERVLERMRNQRIKKQTTKLDAERNASIVPDEITLALARVASENGQVIGLGKDAAGQKVEVSTMDRPLVERYHLNPAIETVFDVLRRCADVLEAQ